MYQAILPGAHTPLTGVRTLHLDYGTSAVLSSSLLEGLLPFLISGSDLLALGPHDLGSFSPLQ